MIDAHAFSPLTSWDEALGHSYCSDFGLLLLKTILKRLTPIVSHSTESTKYLQSRIAWIKCRARLEVECLFISPLTGRWLFFFTVVTPGIS